MSARDAKQQLFSLASAEVAQSSVRFFKSGPEEYGAGDIFIGVKVPTLRAVAREFRSLPLSEIETLLNSPIHEERHLALIILVLQVTKCDESGRKAVFNFSLRNTMFINNWDLVDCSAPHIVGSFLLDKSRKPLFKLARSPLIWERRIAIVSTQYFIRNNDFGDTIVISEMLLNDTEDLIHKATGWMLREVGQKAPPVLNSFIDRYAADMPRTMLRYAIEKLPSEQRRAYLQKKRS